MTVKEIAQKLGYNGAEKTKVKYKGYDVYECVADDGDAKIGTPTYILVKDGKFRLSEADDWLDIYHEILKTSE